MMNKTLKHRGTVYNGRVGARLRPLRRKPAALTARPSYATFCLTGGPLHRKLVRLTTECDVGTFTFTLRGQTGRYVGSTWMPST